jgi:hypothetical protein
MNAVPHSPAKGIKKTAITMAIFSMRDANKKQEI